jgi:hypothetical protein
VSFDCCINAVVFFHANFSRRVKMWITWSEADPITLLSICSLLDIVTFHDGQSDVDPANFAGSGSLARGRLVITSGYSVESGV